MTYFNAKELSAIAPQQKRDPFTWNAFRITIRQFAAEFLNSGRDMEASSLIHTFGHEPDIVKDLAQLPARPIRNSDSAIYKFHVCWPEELMRRLLHDYCQYQSFYRVAGHFANHRSVLWKAQTLFEESLEHSFRKAPSGDAELIKGLEAIERLPPPLNQLFGASVTDERMEKLVVYYGRNLKCSLISDLAAFAKKNHEKGFIQGVERLNMIYDVRHSPCYAEKMRNNLLAAAENWPALKNVFEPGSEPVRAHKNAQLREQLRVIINPAIAG